ncbi:MAG: hypothetical protein JWQ57_5066, partial [Mucilaginibacter sp.]|nr:hypothetical protein [Mucilaginibacter sp.]
MIKKYTDWYIFAVSKLMIGNTKNENFRKHHIDHRRQCR